MFSFSRIALPLLLTLGVVKGITITVDSAQSGNPGSNAIDGNQGTFWHSQYSNPAGPLPHTATLDLLSSTWISGFTYLPRQDVPVGGKINGNIGQHDIQISNDRNTWTTVISNTVYADTKALKTETFPAVQARYIRIIAKTEAGNRGPWTSASEFAVVLGNATPSPSSSSSTTQLSTSTAITSSVSGQKTVPASISGITVDCAQRGSEGARAIDGNTNTIWDAQYDPAVPLPHNAVLDLGSNPLPVVGFTYLPRQDVPAGGKINGNIGQYKIETSTDRNTWVTASTGTFQDTSVLKSVSFAQVVARYVRITALTEAGNRGPWTSAAEFGVLVLGSASGNAPPAGPSRGSWGPVIQLPLVAAGAFLIPGSGKVLTFSASGRTDFDAKGNTNTATFDPSTGAVSLRDVRETGHDMFCPGLSLDFNGRAIVTGGNNHDKVSIYNPSSDIWSAAPVLKLLRGYQSSTTLSDGRIFTIGGSWLEPELRGGKNGEVYDTNKNTWTLLPGAPVAPMLTNDAGGIFRQDNHAWLFAWKDGSVFQAGPSKAMNWYGTTGSGSRTSAGSRASDTDSMCGIAVMYDAVAGKIFTAGGSPSYENSQATSNVHLITISSTNSQPTVQKLASMSYSRAFHNGVVLPDGKIFVTGGQSYAVPFSDDTAIMQPELWDPETLSFTLLTNHKIPRTYHSIALLLLDGRVFTAGGGLCGGCNTNHLDAEIYTPGYLLNADGTAAARPVINSISATTVSIGSTLTVTTDSAVTKFALVRYGSVTHTVNTDQRRIPLTPTSSAEGTAHTVVIPGDSGVALPGYWMLFALNAQGVPSVAKTLKLTLA